MRIHGSSCLGLCLFPFALHFGAGNRLPFRVGKFPALAIPPRENARIAQGILGHGDFTPSAVVTRDKQAIGRTRSQPDSQPPVALGMPRRGCENFPAGHMPAKGFGDRLQGQHGLPSTVARQRGRPGASFWISCTHWISCSSRVSTMNTLPRVVAQSAAAAS